MAQAIASPTVSEPTRVIRDRLSVEHGPIVQRLPSRNAAIDNARFILIALVVLGHALQPLVSTSTAVEVAYTWIYLFHMPAFVFLCGLVVSNTTVNPDSAGRIVTSLLVPLVIFECLYRGIRQLTNWESINVDHALTEPSWGLWFLVALAAWRLAVPALAAIRGALVITVVTAIALSCSVVLTRDFSLGRIVMLMPFFAAGLVLRPNHLARLESTTLRLAGVVVLVAAIPVSFVVSQKLARSAVFWTGEGNGHDLKGAAIQTALYVIAAAMIASFLALMPQGQRRWTHRGSRSLNVYLVHLLPILWLRELLMDAGLPLAAHLTLAVVGSVVLVFALSSDVVTKVTRPLVSPNVGWLLKPQRRS